MKNNLTDQEIKEIKDMLNEEYYRDVGFMNSYRRDYYNRTGDGSIFEKEEGWDWNSDE